MNVQQRKQLLQKWIKPSSDNEKDQQDRAESMVRKAVADARIFQGSSVAVYTKGSYPNNTNVRRDSDVDVVVELQDVIYYDFNAGVTGGSPLGAYTGSWTPTTWRRAVEDAMVIAFGASGVDRTGQVAVKIKAVPGSRPSADVVPSFKYYRYDDAARAIRHEGSCVFPKTGNRIVNWPTQQLEKGRKLNADTGGRYKDYVRALKNCENVLARSSSIKQMPSYFMECVIFNASTSNLRFGDLDQGFRATLVDVWEQMEREATEQAMVEPNWMKWLFTSDKKWSLKDGQDLVLATWQYFGYGD